MPTTSELSDSVLEQHLASHAGTMSIVWRIAAYSVGMLLSMLAASAWFGDTYTANLGLFMLFSGIFELLSAGTLRSRRLVWYCVCVALMGAAGVFLLKQTTANASGQTGAPVQSSVGSSKQPQK